MMHNAFGMGPALLFCPADRPERYAKAMDRADAVILDLEDAVAPEDRVQARESLVENPLDPERTVVRVNAQGTSDFDLDLAALKKTDYCTIMVAKAEDPGALADLVRYRVIALCETAAGILAAPRIAEVRNVVGLMWGAEDLVASLGGTSSRHATGGYRDVALHSRSRVLLAAGAFAKVAIDSVYLDFKDLDGLGEEARDAVASGFGAKACIHPGQAETVRNAYKPTPEEADYARRVLAAAEDHGGVFQLDGRMVDGPVLRHAEATVRRVRP